jgi:hypothetical protein
MMNEFIHGVNQFIPEMNEFTKNVNEFILERIQSVLPEPGFQALKRSLPQFRPKKVQASPPFKRSCASKVALYARRDVASGILPEPVHQ